jgi:hypothetical protein
MTVKLEAPVDDEARKNVQTILIPLDRQMAKLPFSYSLRQQYTRFKKTLETSTDRKQLFILGEELHANIVAELTSKVFLVIPQENADLYEQPEPPFGLEVAQQFLDANYDIEAGTRCLALDEWTASVFHMMRVLESGLRNLVGRLQVQMTAAPDYENWHQIITAIENEIARLRNLPRTQRPKPEVLDFYSEAATNLRYFKDAWRNHVSHSRATYDERRAREIWGHVRSFMQRLAAGPS